MVGKFGFPLINNHQLAVPCDPPQWTIRINLRPGGYLFDARDNCTSAIGWDTSGVIFSSKQFSPFLLATRTTKATDSRRKRETQRVKVKEKGLIQGSVVPFDD